MANTFYPASGGQRGVLILLGLGLAIILVAALLQRINNPSLVTQIDPQRAQQGGMGGEGGMNPELGKLMQQVSENPNDFKALVHLAEHLVNDQQWDAAESFARRASTVNPNDSQPLYLMGVILHNKGQHQEAAASLEKVVKLKDEASVRYSLGVLYIYFLKNSAKGIEHLTAALNDPQTSEAMKTSLREELEKVPLPGSEKGAEKTAPKPAEKIQEKGKATDKPKGSDKAKAK